MDGGCFRDVVFEGQMDTGEGSSLCFLIEQMRARLEIACPKNPEGAFEVVRLPVGTRGDLYWDAEGWRFERDETPVGDNGELARLLAEAQGRARSLEYVALILGDAYDPPRATCKLENA